MEWEIAVNHYGTCIKILSCVASNDEGTRKREDVADGNLDGYVASIQLVLNRHPRATARDRHHTAAGSEQPPVIAQPIRDRGVLKEERGDLHDEPKGTEGA